jgi:snRNA-activating protein complex subunit 3
MDDELECSIGIADGECDPSSSRTIPRGGPIYLSNMSSPITRVSLFQDSLLSQLQVLEAELPQDSSSSVDDDDDDDDLSVDDLKVFTEEELMDMALKQVFQGTKENNSPLFNQPNNNAPE